jgi:FtsP/CotA-like multicopper oxidase with cupredoxin domain
MGMGAGGMMRFTIDGKEFDPDRVDQQVRLGTVEEWTVINTSPMDHPLHLHVWPMQIVEHLVQPVDPAVWRDVVNLPAQSRTTIRVAFDAFPGRTVYHCHILDHEDNGMMGVIEVR